ncbi:hypothetical protein J7E93_05810 [Streptomyces sp. ISL-36]|nr:hypothetical protein [Streptomyces sp. ISL-36]
MPGNRRKPPRRSFYRCIAKSHGQVRPAAFPSRGTARRRRERPVQAPGTRHRPVHVAGP